MISGDVRKYRKGLRFVMGRRYEATLASSGAIPLTNPLGTFQKGGRGCHHLSGLDRIHDFGKLLKELCSQFF